MKHLFKMTLLFATCAMILPAMAQEVFIQDDDTNSATAIIPVDTLAADTTENLLPNTLDLPWPQSVQQRLGQLLQSPLLETTQLGFLVYDLNADSTLYSYNARQIMRPASTMKVVTAVTALDLLGGDHRFNTELSYTGTLENGTLTGDLYVIGGFDPQFNGDDLNAFIESMRKLGIDTICGHLYADRSMKDKDLLGEGWCWDDDNPILSPLLIGRKDLFMERFERELRRAGIQLHTTVGEAPCPKNARPVCHRFHTMEQILTKMLKQSDNLYAEAMFYQIAASGSRPATAKQAATIIKRLIAKQGLSPASYRIADGSGLSLYNYVSAELLVSMLRYAYQNKNIYEYLLPALPQAGIDGTLKSRMQGIATRGRVQAKTGTVSAISSLAGYCTAVNDHRLAFAIINQGVMSARMGRDFQDRICTILCQ